MTDDRIREVIENLRDLRDRDQSPGDYVRRLLTDAANLIEATLPPRPSE